MKNSVRKLLNSDTGEADDIDLQLAVSCEQYLNQRVEFRPASKRDTYLECLKEIYEPLNKTFEPKAPPRKMQVDGRCGVEPESIPLKQQAGENDLPTDDVPKPRQIICSPDTIQLEWKNSRGVGTGLKNMGNTCFLNSVLQCLTYTPPLVNYLNAGDHKKKCTISGFCAMCELQCHITRVFGPSGVAVRPVPIVQNLKTVAKHFRFGRQEDAHEFLRYFVDALQRACLHQFPTKLDPYSKHTTVVHQIFGGYHRSQVKCLHCMKTSNTYDPLLDISLDIKGCASLTKALQKSIKADMLDGDNKYACPFCKKMTKAHKRFTIHRLPNVLTIQLKRFEYNSLFGGKLNKSVMYPEHLDVRPYMSTPQGENEWYRLYAVLVHLGLSCHSGHYFCYVNGANKVWYCLNDAQVQQVSLDTALSQEAYLLFYIRDSNFKPPPPPPTLSVVEPLHPPPAPSATLSSVANKPKEVAAAPASDETSSADSNVQSKVDSTLGVPVQRPKKSDKASPTHPQSKPTGVVNPSPKIVPAFDPQTPKVDMSLMAPPPPPPEKQPVVSSAEDSFELRKNATVPPKQVVPQSHPAPAKPPPSSPLVRPAFMPRALKLNTKAPASKTHSSPLPFTPGLSKLPPTSPGFKDLKCEKSELDAANEPVLPSRPPASASQTFPGIGGDLLSPRVARVQPQPHKSNRPVARVPPSPQPSFRDINMLSREQASSSDNKAWSNSASSSAVIGERTSHLNPSSHWRVSDSNLSAEPNSECPIPESDYSPGWIITPVKKVPASSVTTDQRDGAVAGMGAKIVFKKSQNWAHHKQHRQALPSDSDLESDEEGPFVKPKKVVAAPTKELASSGKSSKSRHSSVVEREYSSHRRYDGSRKHYHQSRHQSSTTTSSSSSSSTDEECHSKRRKRHYYRSSSSSSYSSESDEYRSSKRARSDHYRRHRRKSEDGYHHKRHHHSRHHPSPHRGYDSNDSSSSSSVLARKRSRHPDHRSRYRSESHRHRSDSDRSRSPKRRKDRHHSHHHHHQRKSSPSRKEHHHHHHHERMSLSSRKKTGATGSRRESESRDKHHRDSTDRDSKRFQSRREIKWDDGGMVRSDSKSASGQSHKSVGISPLPAILAKGSYDSLGDSVRTWSGERNSIDASRLEGEGTSTGRDEWDKEFDRGKLKKVKKHHGDKEWSSKNPFQEHQSKKNKGLKADM